MGGGEDRAEREEGRRREVVWEEGGGWVMPKDRGKGRGEGVGKGERKREMGW